VTPPRPATAAAREVERHEPPRILFYSHDGFGLGHLRRNLKLATRLIEEQPEASALLVAGLPGTPDFDLPPGIDLVKLPAIRKTGTDQWQPRQLRLDVAHLRQLRRAMLDGIFGSYDPHLVVVDYLPLGVWSELLEPLLRLRQRQPRAGVVLGLREVLDSPLVTRRSWREGGHDDAVRRLFDRVHVYGDPELYDTALVYGLEELAPGRVEYTGYVCGAPVAGDVGAERARLGMRLGDDLVLVTAGGGADAFPMMQLAVAACRRLAEGGRRLRMLVVTGPLMPCAEVDELRRLAAARPITVERWLPGLEATMSAADAVVTMGAYNTLSEAVRLGRPVVAVPRPGPSAEQTTRARIFAERGLVRTLGVESAPEELAALLAEILDRPWATPERPAMDGLAQSTARLRELLARVTALPRGVAGGSGRLA
jgi:predicted glycosyltransferase